MNVKYNIHELRLLLTYEPALGELRWKTDMRHGIVKKHSLAGSIDSNGYRLITVRRNVMKAHRIAWLLHYGCIDASMMIDHIDGNRSNNRITNLRLVNNATNTQNRTSANANSKSGVLGASKHKSGKWVAQIQNAGKKRNLGLFATALEAHAAYVAAKLGERHENTF